MEKNDKSVILLVCPSLAIGGREKIALNTFEVLKPYYDVKLVVFQRRENEYESEVEILNLNAYLDSSVAGKSLMQLKRAREIAHLYRKFHAKAIIAFGESANTAACLARLFGAKRIICCIHGFGEVSNSRRMKLILSVSDQVVCISKAIKSTLENRYRHRKKLVTIENGYDIARIRDNSKVCEGSISGTPKLIAMGRLEEVKGYDVMLRSFSLIAKEYPKASLTILGEGKQRHALEALARELNISDKTLFLGNRKNPYGYLKQANLLLLTSRNEGFPNVLIEALACELPIVSVDCQSGPREILTGTYSEDKLLGFQPCEYGVLVEQKPDNEELAHCFADAVLHTLTDDGLRSQLKEKALKRANMFSLDVFQQKLLLMLQEN